jgi:phosphatidylserine/phosphatidylglycerophosphate/cardiolipin synthase-like enzyme
VAGVTSTEIILDTLERVPDDKDEDDDEPDKAGKFPRQEWIDKACRVALVRSEPCSAGSDAIFRHVLGAIASARESIIMCMGHSNKPMSMARALGEAVKRGVRVQILVNSIFSCDLRVNQRDLFRSIQDLLTVAPGVEVYTTALRSHRTKVKRSSLPQSPPAAEEKKEDFPPLSELKDEEGSDAPPFLHSKYTVVDHKWTAVGSWNVWTRSAFYEIEHELLIESEAVAARLEEKFEKEKEATSILLTTPEECAYWCPTGCKLCMPFGPFYV